MLKFGRNYVLKFKIGTKKQAPAGTGFTVDWQEEVTISYPLTLQFSVNRSDFQVFDSCSLQITNLNEDTRAKLYKDMVDVSKYIQVEFFAGYGEDVSALPRVYYGEVYECYSWKQGAGTEFLTEITCLTGVVGGAYSQSNVSFDIGTKPLDVIKKLCNDIGYPLLGYSQPLVDSISTLKRKTSYCGNSLNLLKDFVNPEGSKDKIVNIDNDGIYILTSDTVINDDKQAFELSIDSGLLGYPKRRNRFLDVEMLFEPRIQHCQAVQLVSSIDEFFNGLWKCVGYVHSGVISGAVNGQCTTKIALYTDNVSFNYVKRVDNGK